jgi:hypothetical protein
MIQNLLSELSQLIDCSKDIKLDDVPEYHLYISQLEEFLDKKLGKTNSKDEERKVISKTMIQNYIKDGLLMPPEGKSYNRSHIILLILIYSLKPILSIRDIQKLFSPILPNIDEEGCIEIDDIYENYLALKDASVQELKSKLELLANRIEEQLFLKNAITNDLHKFKLMLFISTLATEANLQKLIAEFLIDKYFVNEE